MEGGRWVTVHGRHVLLVNGKPEWKGKQFTAKKPSTDNELLRATKNVNPNYTGKGTTSINCTKCVKVPKDNWDWEMQLTLGRDHAIKQIKDYMDEWGPGSRAIVRYDWNQIGASKHDNAHGGHVINVVQTENGTKFIDAQSGGILKDKDVLKYYIKNSGEIYRTDNKEINEDVAKGAYKKRR